MLAAIGEDPVASLSSGLDDAEDAVVFLDRVSKKIQTKGWDSNTETYQWVRNADGEVVLSDTVMRIDTVRQDKWIAVSVRRSGTDRKLWKKEDRTFVFSRDPWVEVVWNLPFEDLTFELQNYIVAKATQDFQASRMGSVALDGFTTRDVDEAWASLLDAEGEVEDLNMIRSNTQGYNATYRNTPGGHFL